MEVKNHGFCHPPPKIHLFKMLQAYLYNILKTKKT